MPKKFAISAVTEAEMAEPSPTRIRSVEKNFRLMRSSVRGADYTPFPRLQGWICKVGDESDNVRYFQLNNHYLNYWDSKKHFDQDAHPIGSFDLSQVQHLWFDANEFDICFRFRDGTVRILHFDYDCARALRKWYQEIDNRVRYFQGLGPRATAEASLDAMRQAAAANGVDVGPDSEKHKPAEVQKLKNKVREIGLRGASLAVPAPPVIKRFGYRKSVSYEDKTPYPRVQGYLKKMHDKKYYQLNNEYMNYWKDKHAWQEGKPPKGSYNIIHFTDVFRDGVDVVIHFVTGEVRRLEAPNVGIARQWVQFIDLRRRWFEDIHSARESERKVKQKISKGEKIRRKSIDAMVSNVRADSV